MLFALSVTCMYGQWTQEYNSAVETLNRELQNNTKDNNYQRDIRYQVKLNSRRELTIIRSWRQNDGKEEQVSLRFHPRDIVEISQEYNPQSNALALAIQCRENTVLNYWADRNHLNSSVAIHCLDNNAEAIQLIQDTLLRLRELAYR